jgi:glyoxylase I family protein
MTLLKVSQMAISCKDQVETEKFYTKYFGFKRARVAPIGNNEEIIFLKLGDMYLELFQGKGETPVPAVNQDGPTYPAWRHFGFQVDNVDAKLAEMGKDAKITLGPLNFDSYISGWRSVWISDPNGNIIEISQGYVDQDNPPPLVEN